MKAKAKTKSAQPPSPPPCDFYKPHPHLSEACAKFPPLLRLVAESVIPHMDDVHQILGIVGEHNKEISIKVDLDAWHDLYRSPSVILQPFLAVFFGDPAHEDFLNLLASSQPDDPMAFEKIEAMLPTGPMPAHLNKRIDAARGDIAQLDAPLLANIRHFSHHLKFFLGLVFIPCLCHYNQTPFELLLQVRSDRLPQSHPTRLQAFANLLRLDKRILGVDEKLSRFYATIMSSGTAAQRALLTQAMDNHTLPLVNPTAMRVLTAALLVEVAHKSGVRLQPKTIRKLFDAAALDKKIPGVFKDTAVQPGDAFNKAVVRARKRIKKWLAASKKSRAQKTPFCNEIQEREPDKRQV